MLTFKQKLFNMMVMQNDMNKIINPKWWEQEWPWRYALAAECAEARDHFGMWEWWKYQPQDLEQAQMEVVDIFHFGLSIIVESIQIQINDDPEVLEQAFDDVAKMFEQGWNHDQDTSETTHHDYLDALVLEALSHQMFAVAAFRCLCDYSNLSFDRLYHLYTFKNVLNKFRQENGYQDGTYMKTWPNGKEDNQVLTGLMDEHPDLHPKDLIKIMHKRYRDAEAGIIIQ